MLDQAMTRCDAPRGLARRSIRNGWIAAVSMVAMMLVLGATASVAGAVGLVVALSWYRGRRSPWLAAWLVRRARRKSIREGRVQREVSLFRAGVRDHELADLTSLVDEIARRDPDAIDRYDLEALLDRYAEVEIARTRTRAMLQRFDRGVLARQLAAITPGTKRTRRDLLQRRLDHLEASRERVASLNDDVDEIRELICLLAQRTSVGDCGIGVPDDTGEPGEVERRLMMLEGLDVLDDHPEHRDRDRGRTGHGVREDDDVAMGDRRLVIFEPSLRETGT